jgi:hypothetical protein
MKIFFKKKINKYKIKYPKQNFSKKGEKNDFDFIQFSQEPKVVGNEKAKPTFTKILK